MIYVIGDSTSIRMHELFIERYGDQYDRYRGTAKNDYRDGTWNCRNTNFIVAYVLDEPIGDTVLFNSGLWDVGVHAGTSALRHEEYKLNVHEILYKLTEHYETTHVFETINVHNKLKLNDQINSLNEILRDACDIFGAHYIETNKPLGYDDSNYEPEGFHLKPAITKKLFGIITDKLED